MTSLSALWLPILLSSVIVFVASSVIHMALPWHKSDYPQMPNEDKVLEALRPFNIPPGDYMIPRAPDMAAMRSPEFIDKLKKGPVLVATVFPNGPGSMGRNLALWFVFSVAVGTFAAYVAGRALPVGANYLSVFRFIGVMAFVGYSMAQMHESIWWGRRWSWTIRNMLDGLLYGLLTGGTFGWLWPR